MHKNRETKPLSLLGGVLWTVFGILIALPPAAVAFLSIEFFSRIQWGFPDDPKPDYIRVLFLTVPALLIFIGISRAFPRGSALFANLLFAAFVSWRAWSFHIYAQRFFTRWAAERTYI